MQIRDHFSKVELQQLLARSDAQAWLAVLTSWVLVALAFALVALWPNLLTNFAGVDSHRWSPVRVWSVDARVWPWFSVRNQGLK